MMLVPDFHYCVVHLHRDSETGKVDIWETPIVLKTLEAAEWEAVHPPSGAHASKIYVLDDLGMATIIHAST